MTFLFTLSRSARDLYTIHENMRVSPRLNTSTAAAATERTPQISLLGSYMGSKHELVSMLKFFEDGSLKAVVDRVLDSGDLAYLSIEARKAARELARERLGGLHSAVLSIESLDFAPMAALQQAEDWTGVANAMVEAGVGQSSFQRMMSTFRSDAPQYRIDVDRVIHRLPHAHVVERLFLVVKSN